MDMTSSAFLQAHQCLYHIFLIHARMFPQTDSSWRVLTLPYIQYTVTSHLFSQWDKDYVTLHVAQNIEISNLLKRFKDPFLIFCSFNPFGAKLILGFHFCSFTFYIYLLSKYHSNAWYISNLFFQDFRGHEQALKRSQIWYYRLFHFGDIETSLLYNFKVFLYLLKMLRHSVDPKGLKGSWVAMSIADNASWTALDM